MQLFDFRWLARPSGRVISPRIIAISFPMTYFVPISIGTFTKGLGFHDLMPHLAELAVFIPALTLLSLLFLRKQER